MTSEDDDSSIGDDVCVSDFDDSFSGYESDELKFDNSREKCKVSNAMAEKWFIGSGGMECPLDKLLEEKSTENISFKDVIGLQFNTVEASEIFYRKYSLYIGFSVRRDDQKKDGNSVVLSRRWVCSRAGLKVVKEDDDGKGKKHSAQPTTRVRCCAEIKIRVDKNSGAYIVFRFNPLHNHDLVCPYQLHFLRSNRNVNVGALATVVAMRRVGVSTRQIMELFVAQCDGYEYVGFTKKDLQNALNEVGYGEVETSDAETMLAYFRAKGQADNDLFVRYNIDDSNNLRNLFWADSISRYDYGCFGDVIGFDSTYNKNKYKKPVIMVIGSNNHWRTTVYGVGVLANETFESYCWLLQTFLDAMYQKRPGTIITDGDKAMRAAVREIFPTACHRLCAWHLYRNAQKHVHNRQFLSELGSFMYGDLSVSNFESKWRVAVHEHNVERNKWVRRMYKMRHMWGAAYLKGTFFAEKRTTQRCERLNGILKKHFKRKFKMHQLVEEMDRILLRIRNNELADDYKSQHSSITLSTHLQVYEQQAARLYTRQIFLMVRDEIVDKHHLVPKWIATSGGTELYVVRRFLRLQKEWLVRYRKKDRHIGCSCKLFESEGLPCSHAFAVLKGRHEKLIPDSLIHRRWLADAKQQCAFGLASSPSGSEKVWHMVRFGSLAIVANRVCFIASQDDEKYDKVMEYLNNVCVSGSEMGQSSQIQSDGNSENDLKGSNVFVGDQVPAKTKGARRKTRGTPRRQYRCGKCQGYGHNSQSCLRTKASADDGQGEGEQAGCRNDYHKHGDDDGVWDEVNAISPIEDELSGNTCELSI